MIAALATVMIAVASGATVELHQQTGVCVGGARMAVYVPHNGPRVPGCWVLRGAVVHIAFLDGDSGSAPVDAFRPADGI